MYHEVQSQGGYMYVVQYSRTSSQPTSIKTPDKEKEIEIEI